MKYKVTCMFFPDWNNIIQEIFGDAVPIESEYGGADGVFIFSQPVTPADLGPLVRVELISSETQ